VNSLQLIPIRIFLSSPSDVELERAFARAVIDVELPKTPAFEGRVALQVVDWSDPAARIPLLANEDPTESVNNSRPRQRPAGSSS
jgi:hypothetical protein